MCAHGLSAFKIKKLSIIDSNISALEKALKGNKRARALIFGTESLIRSSIYQEYFKDFDIAYFHANELVNLAESLSVDEIKERKRDNKLDKRVLEILNNFKNKLSLDFKPDLIVLACTHFPFFKREFEAIFEAKVLHQADLIFDSLVEMEMNAQRSEENIKKYSEENIPREGNKAILGRSDIKIQANKIAFVSSSDNAEHLASFALAYLS